MTDEAKPTEERPAGAAERPRKPAADAARPLRKPPAKATKPGPADRATDATAIDAAEEALTAVEAPDAATEALAADAQPTQVLPLDAGSEPTRILSPGDGAQPPFAPVPRAVTPSGGGGRRTTLWIVLALAAAAVIALVLVWAFVFRGNGEQFVGSWAPVSGEGGGLVIAQTDGGFEVSMYDGDLQLTGTYPATQDGDALTFRFTDTQTQLGMVQAKLTYEEDRDVLVLRLTAMDEEGAAIEFTRVNALEAAPAATPTVTQSPTASPSASPTGSPSPTPSPTGTDTAQYDQKVVDGIVAVQVGVLNWAAANNNVFPSVAEVTQDGDVAQYVSAWPTNPFTGQPMAASDQEGDYTYEQLNGGLGYKLVGHLANGLTFTVP